MKPLQRVLVIIEVEAIIWTVIVLAIKYLFVHETTRIFFALGAVILFARRIKKYEELWR